MAAFLSRPQCVKSVYRSLFIIFNQNHSMLRFGLIEDVAQSGMGIQTNRNFTPLSGKYLTVLYNFCDFYYTQLKTNH